MIKKEACCTYGHVTIDYSMPWQKGWIIEIEKAYSRYGRIECSAFTLIGGTGVKA